MYHIDFKESCWYRVDFDAEKDFKQAISLLETKNEPAVFDMVRGDNQYYLDDSYESLSVESNNGLPTIEAYNNNDEIIWDNVKGFHRQKTLEKNLYNFLNRCHQNNFGLNTVIKYISYWFDYDAEDAKKIVNQYIYKTGNLFV